MHGCGNDFVVIDSRKSPKKLDSSAIKQMADRRFGVGCDQLVVMAPSEHADVYMHIYNADGSKVATCGNATRCVADILMRESGRDETKIETLAGTLTAWRAEGDQVRVSMGAPKFDWREIPLSEPRNPLHLGLQDHALLDPAAVSMGNPHCIFFVKDLAFVNIRDSGARLEHHPLFPQAANISAVQVIAPDLLEVQVWERGSGVTLACGSAACAVVVAGVLREVCEPKAAVRMPGGTLHIEWDRHGTGEVMMTGPVAYVFEGVANV